MAGARASSAVPDLYYAETRPCRPELWGLRGGLWASGLWVWPWAPNRTLGGSTEEARGRWGRGYLLSGARGHSLR